MTGYTLAAQITVYKPEKTEKQRAKLQQAEAAQE